MIIIKDGGHKPAENISLQMTHGSYKTGAARHQCQVWTSFVNGCAANIQIRQWIMALHTAQIPSIEKASKRWRLCQTSKHDKSHASAMRKIIDRWNLDWISGNYFDGMAARKRQLLWHLKNKMYRPYKTVLCQQALALRLQYRHLGCKYGPGDSKWITATYSDTLLFHVPSISLKQWYKQ